MPSPSLAVSIAAMAVVLSAPSAAALEARTVELDTTNPRAEIVADGFTARLAMETVTVDGWTADAPVLRIEENGETVLTVTGEQSGFDFPIGSMTVGELDPTNTAAEVVFSSYSGGAHCCTHVRIARKATDGTWEVIEAGAFDGDGARPEDIDGDGVLELVTIDNDFLYAFDCYACSAAPLAMLALRGSSLVDVSADPRFVPRHREWLRELELRQADLDGEPAMGWWPGWIAAKSRVGEGAEAWSIFMTDYDPAEDPGVEVCTLDVEDCPETAYQTVPFPDALRAFLDRQGYPIGTN